MREAQKVAGKDQSLLGTGLAYVLCVVETEKGSGVFERLTVEEIDALAIADSMKLINEASAPLGDEPTQEEAAAAIEQALKKKTTSASSGSSPTST